MSTPVRKFISYATEYDLYKGTKDWNDLLVQSQNDILIAELLAGDTEEQPESLIMRHGLMKAQAQGLRSVIVASALALERAKRIPAADAWDAKEMAHIIDFLTGTPLGQRLKEAADGVVENVTPLPTETLAELASPDSLDELLFMELEEAQDFLREMLGGCENSASPSYSDFKRRLSAGEIGFVVDKGMAVYVGGSIGNGWSVLFSWLFNLSLLMIIPAIFIWGFWAALGFVAGAIFSFRLTRYALVQKVRKAVMEHEEWYRLFLEKGVIRLCKPTGELL
jgi:hypothetical protein